LDRCAGGSESAAAAGSLAISAMIFVKPWTPISRSKPLSTHARVDSSIRRDIIVYEPCRRWCEDRTQSAANADIIAVPMATFVQASRRSAGVRLKRAAQDIGIAISPSAGRPPLAKSASAISTACSGEVRSSWVTSETKSPRKSGFASDTFRMNASTRRSSGWRLHAKMMVKRSKAASPP
jgi:hypothetical protein